MAAGRVLGAGAPAVQYRRRQVKELTVISATENSPHQQNGKSGPHLAQDDLTPPPDLVIVKGDPTDEEIAAVVAVLFARAAPAEPPAPRPVTRSEWSAGSRRLRAPLVRGPGAWRASALPR